jgi:hypothetical protein
LSSDTFTVVVDGKVPSLNLVVTQTGVNQRGTAVDNLIGQVYNSGIAVLTLTASEEISEFGTITFENYVEKWENITLTINDFTTTDDKVFTYEFDTAGWEEDVENARVVIEAPCCTDQYNLENSSSAQVIFSIDLRPPIIVDNGLNQFHSETIRKQPGTDEQYWTTIKKRWTIAGSAEDNDNLGGNGDADNDAWCTTTIEVNGVDKTVTYLPDESFTLTENLDEGVNVVVVTTTDRVGLTDSDNIDNVFIDNTPVKIDAVTLAGASWTDNKQKTSDNTPTIRLRIYDPGYPTTGWGIGYENVTVYLSENNDENGVIEILENADIWDFGDPSSSYNFENTYENLSSDGEARGLATGTYWIIVRANDNLHKDNVRFARSFTIDVTSPSVATPDATENPLNGTSIASPQVQKDLTLTLSGTGMTGDTGATINVYIRDASTDAQVAKETTTVDAYGRWSKTIDLPSAGVKYKIEVTAEDSSGNESAPVLYGFVLADTDAPTVTISEPSADLTTSEASVSVTATVSDDITEAGDITVWVSAPGFAAPQVSGYPDANGVIIVTVPLTEGTNNISIIATDEAGNVSAADTRTVTRTVTPWATYAAILAVVAVILAAIAVLRRR